MKKKAFIFFLILLSFFCFARDMFRVHQTQYVEMKDETDSPKARLAVNDMLVVKLPQTRQFLQGLSIEIKIPKAIADYRDAVAFYVYKNVSPKPSAQTIDYSGDRVILSTFPGRLSYNFQIPLSQNHTLKETPYSALLPESIDPEEGYVYFRLQLVMKGTPLAVLEAEFDIEVKPLFVDMGLLQLNLIPPNPQARQLIPRDEFETVSEIEVPKIKNNYTLFIDEKPVDFVDNSLLLKPGIHHLSLISNAFRNELRSFSIEQGKTTKLFVQLEAIEPSMQILVPESFFVYFDEVLLTNFSKPYQIEEGDHIIRFALDGYERVKTLKALRGKSYVISLDFDFLIEEK